MQVAFRALSQPSYVTDVPDDILEQLKRLKDGLDALTKWKEEVRQLHSIALRLPHAPSACAVPRCNQTSNIFGTSFMCRLYVEQFASYVDAACVSRVLFSLV